MLHLHRRLPCLAWRRHSSRDLDLLVAVIWMSRGLDDIKKCLLHRNAVRHYEALPPRRLPLGNLKYYNES